MKRIGIIICGRYQGCGGGKCFRVWFPKTPYCLWYNELRLSPGEVLATTLSEF